MSARQCAVCLRKQAKRTTERNKANRLELIHHYGGEAPRCACCGESGIAFLTLDHVARDGGEHRRRLKGHQGTYRELIADGYPPGIQVLCYNCNMAHGLYGACPHHGGGAAERLVPVDLAYERSEALLDERDERESGQGSTGFKRCTWCGQCKALDAFYADPGTRDRRQSWCKVCRKRASAERLRALRIEALTQYGGPTPRCACCGETTVEFLALDHVDGGGVRQRRQAGVRGGNAYLGWLKRNGYAPALQVLCHNCNCAKGSARACPHAVE